MLEYTSPTLIAMRVAGRRVRPRFALHLLPLLAATPLLMGQGCGPSLADDVLGSTPSIPDGQLDVASVQEATWLVIAVNDESLVTATAFGVSADHLATNAHVVDSILSIFNGPNPVAQVFQHETGEFRVITSMWSHPDYDWSAPVGSTPDVGVLEVHAPIPTWLSLAGDTELRSLQVFDEVSMCGFPGSVTQQLDFLGLMAGSFHPRVTCLAGTISALRPLDPGVSATPANVQLIQYDLPTAPGTSGSAVMSQTGRVIAVNSSGFADGGDYNFAMRADLLGELLEAIDGGRVTGSVLTGELVASTHCDTTFRNDEWSVGFDPPPGFVEIAPRVSDLYVKTFKLASAEITFSVTAGSPAGLDETVNDWIATLEGLFVLLQGESFFTSNGKVAYFLEWSSVDGQTHLIETFTESDGGVLWVQGSFPELEFPAYSDMVFNSVITLCAE